MSYFQEYVSTLGREPSYRELKELVELARDEVSNREQAARDELRDQEELARDQIREIRVSLGEEKEKPEPRLAKTCRHLRENGELCRSVAVRDRDFCSYHLNHRGRRLKMARARARQQRLRLQLPPLEDLYAVQVGIDQVLDALLHDQLDRHVGGLVLYGLQQAATNLSRPPEVWEECRPFQSSEQLHLPGFEAEFGLPAGLDLDTAPEVAFPESESGSGTVSEERAAAAIHAASSGAGKAASPAVGKQAEAAGAPLSSAVADRAGEGPATRKEPQSATTAGTAPDSLPGSAAAAPALLRALSPGESNGYI